MDEATQVSVLCGVEEGMPYGGEGVKVISTIARIECRGKRPCSPLLKEGALALGVNDTLGVESVEVAISGIAYGAPYEGGETHSLADIFDEGLVSPRDDSCGKGEFAKEKCGVCGESDATDDRVKGLTREPTQKLGAVHEALTEGSGACHSCFGEGGHLLRAT